MNREIKFRFWKEDIEAMYYDIQFGEFEGEEIVKNSGVNESLEVASKLYKIMQYTGLKDKNDKEIYEGDIIEQEHMVNVGTDGRRVKMKASGIVEFIDARYYVNGKMTIDEKETKVLNALGGRHKMEGEVLEVVGNIYENPDLA